MNNKLKISIIIPAFNSANTIEKTLKSIIDQQYDNIEIIVVDGCSKDNTLMIVKKYESYISKFISESDDGVYDAMNKGIGLSTGDVIGIISSNDWINKNIISSIVNHYHEDPDIDILHGNIIESKYIGDNEYLRIRKGGRLSDLNSEMTIMHPTCFVKKDWYEKYRYDIKFKIAGDYDFLIKSMNNGAKFKYIDEEITIMTQGGLSSTYKTIIESFMIQYAHGLYNKAIKYLVIRTFLYLKSYVLRNLAGILLPVDTFMKIEIKKWGGNKISI